MKSIKHKLLGVFLIIILLITALCVYNFKSVVKFNHDTDAIIKEDLPLLIADEELAFNIAERIALARGYILYNDPSYKEAFLQYTEESKALQNQVLQETNSEEAKQLIDKSIEWRKTITEEVFVAFDKGNKEQALAIMANKVQPLGRDLMSGFKDIADKRKDIILSEGNDVMDTGTSIKNASLMMSIIIIMVAIILAIVTARIISTPIKKVVDRMLQIADGNLQSTNLVTKAKDETAQLIEATNTMNSNLKNVITNIINASDNVKEQSKGLSASANEVKEGSLQIAITMEALASGSQEQAQNCANLGETLSDFIEKIKLSNEEGIQVRTLTEKVKTATISGNKLMSISESNMHNIEDLVEDSVTKVKELDQKTAKINDIISVITSISEQTNLLALNAAIEAARAGEHGKGFAVVADEVRKLAEEVKFSVNDITSIVNDVQLESAEVASSLEFGYKTIQNGTSQIKETAKTFNLIAELIENMSTKVGFISNELESFVDKGQILNMSVTSIASVSEESAAGVEETTASTEEIATLMEQILASAQMLADQSEQLNNITKKFTV
ncbi:methyl-accepting chemotaxis protein [Lysinibacillus sphaericus]|uniref:methyl-accepting chemotaxis protein n=1 Tax=Lysinibacillus sphaericus TaxID=1421 RepID=UPI001E317388|nr:methyl-accepting chemotaxis protein [Lysinibacillus sphaericus]UDK96091.1 methyl-accepting chemotaxis protein [Lysinibacillus sphaericus]